MGYHTSNAAYAYDVQPAPAYDSPREDYVSRPAAPERPRFDVYTGAGREANQTTSPVFSHVVKVFVALAVLFVCLGAGRVTLASATAAVLNQNASVTTALEEAQTETKNLEVMRSVYGSETRIRDLATGYGMTEAEGSVTLDFSQDASAGSSATASSSTSAQ